MLSALPCLALVENRRHRAPRCLMNSDSRRIYHVASHTAVYFPKAYRNSSQPLVLVPGRDHTTDCVHGNLLATSSGVRSDCWELRPHGCLLFLVPSFTTWTSSVLAREARLSCASIPHRWLTHAPWFARTSSSFLGPFPITHGPVPQRFSSRTIKDLSSQHTSASFGIDLV
jgi:hypothetical protein